MSHLKKPETELLEQWETALTNIKQHPDIAERIVKYGYTFSKIKEGDVLLNHTIQIRNIKIEKENETTEAYKHFKNAKDELEELYKTHRRRAKAKFIQQPTVLKRLDLHKTTPRNYTPWIFSVTLFYNELYNPENSQIKNDLLTYNTTEDDLINAKNRLENVDQLRRKYLSCKAAKKQATKNKTAAFKNMQQWMRYFYAMAKDALNNEPQLLHLLQGQQDD